MARESFVASSKQLRGDVKNLFGGGVNGEIAVATSDIASGIIIPGAGEVMDFETLADPSTPGWERALVKVSLGYSAYTGGIGPNASTVTRPVKRGVHALSIAIKRSKAQRLLKLSLGSKPFKNAAAHHIFDFVDHSSSLGKKLTGWGIDLNSSANGVWLPTKKIDGIDSAIHSGRTGGEYKKYVRNMLDSAGTKEEAFRCSFIYQKAAC